MKQVLVTVLLLGLWACQSANKIVGLPCPCTAQYVCCQSLNQCLSPGEFCPDPIDVAQYTQAFAAKNGMQVFLLPVVPAERNQALIEFRGINHSWEGKVYLHHVRAGKPDGRDYVRWVGGYVYQVLIYRTFTNPSGDYIAYVQGFEPEAASLTYSAELSMATSSQSIVDAYYAQHGNASASLAPALDEFKAREQKALQQEIDIGNKSCLATMTGTINWPTYEGVEIRSFDYSVSTSCARAMRAIELYCLNSSGPEKIQANLKQLVCNWGGRGKRSVDLTAGTLTFAIDWALADDQSFVESYLEQKLR